MMVSIQENTDFSLRVNHHKLKKLGRFRWFRHLVTKYKQQRQHLNRLSKVNLDTSIYSEIGDVESIVKQIRDTAVCCGLTLNSQLVREILDFAQTNQCVDPKQKVGNSFYADQYNQVLKNQTNQKIYRGLVTNTHNCRAIASIAYNQISLTLATRFLGYIPTKITTHLTWSFPVSPTDREVYQLYAPTNWHYDVVGTESLTLNFYITNITDGESGPHEYIEKSHVNTPWRLLLSGNMISQKLIDKHFRDRTPISLFGNAGFGFAEDPTCIHRVKPPTSQSRLILQIRYS